MRNTDISFKVELDNNNFPVKINWQASDAKNVPFDTQAISLNVWDPNEFNTLRIDLWTKDMRVNDMKKFFIDCLGGLAQTILNSTGDSFLSNEVNSLCEKLAKHINEENKNQPKD